jgi:flagellar hook-basal body complex protein FliE
MSPVGSIPTSALSALTLNPGEKVLPNLRSAPGLPDGVRVARPGADGFGQMLDGLVATVDTKQARATELTRRVLMGESDQIHQSVIAMQEAGVAFSLMVEVRNKLVDSYQELMRMQV